VTDTQLFDVKYYCDL